MKNLNIKIVILSALLVLAGSNVWAAFSSNDKGTTGATFLKISKGVRATGMGGAYAGVSDDAESIYWNPAGLNYIYEQEITAMHSTWFESIYYNYLSFVKPFDFATAGISINYLGMDEIDKYTVTGAAADDTYRPYNFKITGSFAREFGGHLTGANLKLIYLSIDDESAIGAALDAGYIRAINSDITVGAVIQNMGPKIKFRDEGDHLPFNIKTGASYRNLIEGLILAMDVNFPVDNAPNIAAGAEYGRNVTDKVSASLRLGYRTNLINDLTAVSGVSTGFSVSYTGITINYAWDPYDRLNSSHRFSFAYKF